MLKYFSAPEPGDIAPEQASGTNRHSREDFFKGGVKEMFEMRKWKGFRCIALVVVILYGCGGATTTLIKHPIYNAGQKDPFVHIIIKALLPITTVAISDK